MMVEYTGERIEAVAAEFRSDFPNRDLSQLISWLELRCAKAGTAEDRARYGGLVRGAGEPRSGRAEDLPERGRHRVAYDYLLTYLQHRSAGSARPVSIRGLDPVLHHSARVAAMKQQVTIGAWINEAIADRLKKEPAA